MGLGIALVEAADRLGVEGRECILTGAIVLHRAELDTSVQIRVALFLALEVVLTFYR